MIDVDKLRPIYSERSAEHLAMKNLALYDEADHMAMAKRYSDGELVYWKKQRDWFTIQLNSSTFWGKWWLLLDCPDPEENDFLRSFIDRSNSLTVKFPVFDESFWIKDIDRFFELYFPYQRINDIINKLGAPFTRPFPNNFSETQLKEIFNRSRGMIKCSEADFLYWFSGTGGKANKIKWVKEKGTRINKAALYRYALLMNPDATATMISSVFDPAVGTNNNTGKEYGYPEINKIFDNL